MEGHRDDVVLTRPTKVYSDEQFAIEIPETAHQITSDSWFQVGFVLTTGINSAYVLGYSGAVMVPLGWVGGVVGLVLATAISLHANTLIAKLHEFGGKRHIRYIDLAGFIYGPKAYSLTWVLQYVNLFMINVRYVILAGQALKESLMNISGSQDAQLMNLQQKLVLPVVLNQYCIKNEYYDDAKR